MTRVPEHHGSGEGQERPFLPLDPRPDLAQIGEPHCRGVDAGRRQSRGMQHLERRLHRGQVEREMRPLLDDTEKHHFASGEALLRGEALPDNLGNAGRGQHYGARLAAIELDHQILVAPDRDEEADGIGDALDDPAGVVAAQAGPFEAGVSIEVRCSHAATLAHPPARRQAESPQSAARRRSR